MVCREVVISAKRGKLWKITARYMKLCKMKSVYDLEQYNLYFFKLQAEYRENEALVYKNEKIDFIDYEKRLKEIVSCIGKK
jgi:hypothetical protein